MGKGAGAICALRQPTAREFHPRLEGICDEKTLFGPPGGVETPTTRVNRFVCRSSPWNGRARSARKHNSKRKKKEASRRSILFNQLAPTMARPFTEGVISMCPERLRSCLRCAGDQHRVDQWGSGAGGAWWAPLHPPRCERAGLRREAAMRVRVEAPLWMPRKSVNAHFEA